jgi:hypothetical protein
MLCTVCFLSFFSAQAQIVGIPLKNGTTITGSAATATASYYSYTALTFPNTDFPLVVAISELSGATTLSVYNLLQLPTSGLKCTSPCVLHVPLTPSRALLSPTWIILVNGTATADNTYRLRVTEQATHAGAISILNPAVPTVWLDYPAGPAVHSITWQSFNLSSEETVDISLSPIVDVSGGGCTASTLRLASSYPNSGSFNLNLSTIPASARTSCLQWTVQVILTEDPAVSSQSAAITLLQPLSIQLPAAGLFPSLHAF